MTQPAYIIKVYDDGNLLHTIIDKAELIHIKNVLNGVGSWNFLLPNTTTYNDITPHDTVKIYVEWGSVGAADPLIVGRVSKISGSAGEGKYKLYEGKDLGEILERRFKRENRWISTAASDIVEELADDLGLGKTEIAAETQTLTLVTEKENYYELLRRLSDFWVSSGVQLKKDFYVDIDNNLVWADRPLRDSGVESLTVGSNIDSYSVLSDVLSVKNKMYVYGSASASAAMPKDENWTESLDEWTKFYGTGTLVLDPSYKTAGSYSIRNFCQDIDGTQWCGMRRTTLPEYQCVSGIQEEQHNSFGRFKFDLYLFSAYGGNVNVRPELITNVDDADYFHKDYASIPVGSWNNFDLEIGIDTWLQHNSPDWRKIVGFAFRAYRATYGFDLIVDNVRFGNGYFYDFGEDGSSQTDYGLRELMHYDELLNSDGDCEKRAETLLYQLSDPVTRVDLKVKGNSNILIGDRIPLTIATEGISAQDFDVVTVEHNLNQNGWATSASLIDSGNTRELPPKNAFESINKQIKIQREIIRGTQIIR